MTINFKSTAKIKLIKNCISDIEKVRLNLNDYECDSGYKRIINTSLISKIRGLQNYIESLTDENSILNIARYYEYDSDEIKSFNAHLFLEDFNAFIKIQIQDLLNQYEPNTLSENENCIFRSVKIEELLNKCKEKLYSKDYSGVITNSRSLIEELSNEIISKYSKTQVDLYKRDVGKMIKDVKQIIISLNSNFNEDFYSQILSGLSSIMNGLSALRNKAGDSHARRIKPTKKDAELAYNIAILYSAFLSEIIIESEKIEN